MANLTYRIDTIEKLFRVIAGEIKSPPMTAEERREAGVQIRLLQRGHVLSMPVSRPMPSIGARCHELRINDWRIVYRIDADAIVMVEVFLKDSQKTPRSVIDTCRARLKRYDGT